MDPASSSTNHRPADEVAVPDSAAQAVDTPSSSNSAVLSSSANPAQEPTDLKKNQNSKSKSKSKKTSHKKKKQAAETDGSDSSSSSSSSSDDSDSSSDDSRSKKRKSTKKSKHSRSRKHSSKKSKKYESSSDSSSDDGSDSESDDSESERRNQRKSKRKTRRTHRSSTSEAASDGEENEDADANESSASTDAMKTLQRQLAALTTKWSRGHRLDNGQDKAARDRRVISKPKSKSKKNVKRGSTLAFKRVDQLWDKHLHDFRLKESAEIQEDQFDEFIFTVRRCFNWENKYRSTLVDIKSHTLRDALQAVMSDVKGVSLVEEQPSVDPNMLFLYLEELRAYYKTTLKAKLKSEKKKKTIKRLKTMRSECKLLVKYLDEDYADTKKTLYPMLEAGNITFDLLWALFKPNTIAYTPTYGSKEHPRCFKVDVASKESSFTRGEWYCVEGRYLEYDGKTFGLGDFDVDINSFKGARKITSLSTFPLQYHPDPEGLKQQLIERGKQFVGLEGMNYRFHKGLAFMKKKRQVAKVNINGRIMVDPAIFRRINPNYPISSIKPKDADEEGYGEESEEESCGCSENSDNEDNCDGDGDAEKTKMKVIVDDQNQVHVVQVAIDADGNEIRPEKLDALPDGAEDKPKREFTEEELLIASPVVLGFAFSEKLWLEFSLSGVRDIEWNDGAFESLVLPENQKDIVKALVESHKFHAAKTIDDVVQGKGKGLVAVLHGPPGTGKTLTAEGIAELLKCPLYMVSAGELGTDSRMLEGELQKILDIAHSWGAVLLLDEADVFLEKRQVHDIHRNALVSIFLRLLEYFQGILFLTTNRVETFDDAFQSRIHVALRYGELTAKAKKAVWKMFLDRVRAMEGVASVEWTEEDYEVLSRKALNGRQIKNSVRTAQALAVNNSEKLSMEHIKRVLDVAESFEQDLKGGTGYRDAMRQYT